MAFNDDLRIHLGAADDDDLDDEHVRYDLYVNSLDTAGWQTVAGLLWHEPDKAVAEAAFVQIVHRASADQRPAVVESAEIALPQSSYTARRASELDMVEAFESDPVGFEMSDLLTATLWVQLRVAERTGSQDVLQVLSKDGSSKRVRRLAVERLSI